jgi:bifunctional DNA-binding transcriptional regulator/antitoxin component of YhaV-PrlF toxin-antitoxin module
MRSKIKPVLETEKKNFSVERLGEQGQITVPDEYRRALSLTKGSTLAVIQVGNALVLAPCGDEFEQVAGRLEASLRDSGVTLEELLEATQQARVEIVRKEFGEIL